MEDAIPNERDGARGIVLPILGRHARWNGAEVVVQDNWSTNDAMRTDSSNHVGHSLWSAIFSRRSRSLHVELRCGVELNDREGRFTRGDVGARHIDEDAELGAVVSQAWVKRKARASS